MQIPLHFDIPHKPFTTGALAEVPARLHTEGCSHKQQWCYDEMWNYSFMEIQERLQMFLSVWSLFDVKKTKSI